ncbi:hypothetical protein G8C92_26575 [Paenibacillus donghaensis]|uniref:hypothetical protein n=1 Tax=Paenibacillus donghaensis TaxID=414771 RepID=UPI001883E615|nr:hypothetical protein [Paenibacillus donghaensis]MBE9917585.1 hypothetical protein [Paenibacillus donghaensis]
MTDKPFLDDELDDLIRNSLLKEETPHPAIQAALIQKIKQQESGFKMPWWLPATIGAMQTAAVVAAIHVLLPGTLISHLATIFGSGMILCACALSGLVRKVWARKDADYSCGL